MSFNRISIKSLKEKVERNVDAEIQEAIPPFNFYTIVEMCPGREEYLVLDSDHLRVDLDILYEEGHTSVYCTQTSPTLLYLERLKLMNETMKIAEVRSWIHRNPRGYVYTQITPIIGSDNPTLAVINNKYLLSTLDELPGDRDIVAKKLSSFELLVGN